jgi:hypothetical protein
MKSYGRRREKGENRIDLAGRQGFEPDIDGISGSQSTCAQGRCATRMVWPFPARMEPLEDLGTRPAALGAGALPGLLKITSARLLGVQVSSAVAGRRL